MRLSLILFILITSIAATSCAKKEQSFTPKNSMEFLEKVRKTYGSDHFFNSIISFSKKDLDYKVVRKNHILNSSLSRDHQGTRYFTTYENGHIAYYINDILQDDKTYRRKFFDVQLDGFIYTTFIPQVFNGTDILVNRNKDVIIRNKTYNVINVSTKPVEGVERDNFYLYVDPETFYISYLAQEHKLTSPTPIFKSFTNYRSVNKILFADHTSFQAPKNNVPVDSLYLKYEDASLKELRNVALSKIEVTINN